MLPQKDPVLKFFLVSLLAWASLGSVQAVPPPEGQPVPSQPTCKVNPAALQARLSALKAAPFFPTPLAPTTAYVSVVRVDFSDYPMTKTRAETEAFMEKMRNYFLENSYGVFVVSASVTASVYRLPSSLASYAQGVCSNFNGIAKDAMALADADINFLTGAPGANRFNHVMIYHAGIGAETANDSGCATDNLWSVFAPTVPVTAGQSEGVRVPFTYDTVAFNGVTIVPESENLGIDPLGVILHEYGHQLGLPDLYNTSARSVVGKWSLMDSGIYIGSPLGSNPAHLDAWSKQFLGFFKNPAVATPGDVPQNISMDLALSTSSAFLRIPILGLPGVNGNLEYFLVERRALASRTGKTYDDALPFGSLNEGYLIWHVDDGIAASATRLEANNINNGVPNYGLDLVEADGTGGQATTNGDSGDPFPGTSGKTLFATPASDSVTGQQTGIVLSGFSGGTLTLKKAYAPPDQDIARIINFPNPGGPAYPQKAGAPAGTWTTIVLNAARPPRSVLLTIHDLTGRLVKKVPESLIRANGGATATGKFVFEYDWDGRNDEGDSVAPGMYLYRFKVDDDAVKTGKLVIVR